MSTKYSLKPYWIQQFEWKTLKCDLVQTLIGYVVINKAIIVIFVPPPTPASGDTAFAYRGTTHFPISSPLFRMIGFRAPFRV